MNNKNTRITSVEINVPIGPDIGTDLLRKISLTDKKKEAIINDIIILEFIYNNFIYYLKEHFRKFISILTMCL